MTRRTLEENVIGISFPELSDESEDYSFPHWKLQYSSDQEPFFKSSCEVLWSRDNKDFVSESDFCKDTYGSFSDVTGRTVSSCSWHDDDFDMKSSKKVNASLEAIEDALYEKKKLPFMREEVFEECCNWSEKFPYFRLKGEQIVKPVEDSIAVYSPTTNELKTHNSDSSSPCLQVEGKKMTIFHMPNRFFKQDSPECASDDASKFPDFEEIIEDDGDYEECLAQDSREMFGTPFEHPLSSAGLPNNSTIKAIEEKIIDRLAVEMWPNVIGSLQKLNNNVHNSDANEDFQLPPIAATIEQKQYSFQRPKTEGTSLSRTEFPKLSSFLSVSPKVLQIKKEFSCGRGIQRKVRPNSEISLFRRNLDIDSNNKNGFFKASESHCVQPFKNIHKQDKVAKEARGNESYCLILPALEEDSQDPSDVLRGFRIESATKEMYSRMCETSSSSRRADCFLPPINRRDEISTNAKLTTNLFTYFGSNAKRNKNKEDSPEFLKQASPRRPNTSTSRKGVKSSGMLQYCNVNKSANKKNLQNHQDNIDTSVPVGHPDNITHQKELTLFPIVTSLLPSKERNYSTDKKGLINNFVGGRKR